MATTRVVLVAGATGTIGFKAAKMLMQKNDIKVRAIVRESGKERKEQQVKLKDLGAELIVADLADQASLDRACDGVEAVLSTVQGGPEVIVDGQLRLLKAATRAGVKRFLPSDFSGDYNGIAYGDNFNYDPRKHFAEQAPKNGTAVTHIMIGALTEVFFAPMMGMFNFAECKAEYWGSGDELVDLTTIHDVGRYAAEASLDARVDGTDFRWWVRPQRCAN